jgi:hypothetical protein
MVVNAGAMAPEELIGKVRIVGVVLKLKLELGIDLSIVEQNTVELVVQAVTVVHPTVSSVKTGILWDSTTTVTRVGTVRVRYLNVITYIMPVLEITYRVCAPRIATACSSEKPKFVLKNSTT